jgi:KDO2-lipid IV(A) lauroyltransferase
LTSALRPLLTRLIPLLVPRIRTNTRLNARRIFNRVLSPAEQRVFTRNVMASFYSFITDIACASRQILDPHRADAFVASVYGTPAYRAMRAQRRGAVLVTAHIGSFEAGLLALRRVEPAVHVVFKRDHSAPFERMRSSLRRSIGVHEAPIDDGLSTWVGLRDALLRDEVVVMQADRVLPGQQSAVVAFLGGSLRIPTGPVRLARLAGSPIVPVFTVRRADGRNDIHLEQAIEPHAIAGPGTDLAVLAVAQAIASVVAKHPEQWLVLDAAFEEDRRGRI